MKKDAIERLFEGLEGKFDVHETPAGHQQRFLEKLNSETNSVYKTRSWWKPLSIAASVVVLIGMGMFFFNTETQAAGLASVSPEMENTQSYFTTAINRELETLKSFRSPETKAIIEDALAQIEILEKDYQKLTVDLVESGNDKRVIHAMIQNFQNRIDLLEQVTTTIEEINNTKNNENETTI
ncbi:hypothetical protein [Constantimarinum furrinae]|uniref:Uncharacterized protein n=1 Tax=Constantimarinum furrinae TaxID=2562285 RepID=A0A7G8PX11_9FLAO|nr:hypothetical protein [Constantimarinum furrinae]QNJ98877.1 hypothetical protein ALE3EI_2337 [Constantimarinum furrinae]